MASAKKSITKYLRKCQKDGKSYPLLDCHWIDASQYIPFRALESNSSDAVELWRMETSRIIHQYSCLLLLEFDKFWCELIYKRSLISSLDTFLHLCPRYLQIGSISSQCLSLIEQLKTVVLYITLRSSKSSDPGGLYIDADEYADLIYNHFIFDAPRLMAFVLLYSQHYQDTVIEVLRNVCTNQPKYISDVLTTVQTSSMILQKKQETLQNWQFDFEHQPVSSEEGAVNDVEGMIKYISEIGNTLGIFLSVCADSCKQIISKCISADLPITLAKYHDSLIPVLRGEILRNLNWSYETKEVLIKKLSVASAALIKAVRVGLIEPGILNELMNLAFGMDPSPSRSKSIAEIVHHFLDMMLQFHNHKAFASAYSLLYSVDDDLNLIVETANSNDIDDKTVDYIRQAFTSLSVECVVDQVDSLKVEVVPPNITKLLGSLQEKNNLPGSSQSHISNGLSEKYEDCQPGPSRLSAFGLIKSILPNTDDALIDRCLEHYNGSADSVVEALLEDTVPAEVKNPKLVRKKSKQRDQVDEISTMDLPTAAVTGLITLDAKQLWQGKRNQNEHSLPPLSRDVREKTKDLCVSVYDDDDDQCWFPSKISEFRSSNVDLYEDEYNDTYDMAISVPEGSTNEPVEVSSLGKKKPTVSFSEQSKNPSHLSKPIAPGGISPRTDARLINNGITGLDTGYHTSLPPRTVLRIENPEVLRERRQAHMDQKAFRKGRLVPSIPTDIEPQPLPANGEFFPSHNNWRGSHYPNQRGGSVTRSTRRPNRRINGKFSSSGYENLPPRQYPNHPQERPRQSAPHSTYRSSIDQEDDCEHSTVENSSRGNRGASGRNRGYPRESHNQRFLSDRKRMM